MANITELVAEIDRLRAENQTRFEQITKLMQDSIDLSEKCVSYNQKWLAAGAALQETQKTLSNILTTLTRSTELMYDIKYAKNVADNALAAIYSQELQK